MPNSIAGDSPPFVCPGTINELPVSPQGWQGVWQGEPGPGRTRTSSCDSCDNTDDDDANDDDDEEEGEEEDGKESEKRPGNFESRVQVENVGVYTRVNPINRYRLAHVTLHSTMRKVEYMLVDCVTMYMLSSSYE